MQDSLFARKVAQGGFSLVELLVTLAIVALLAALAIPTFTGYIRSAKLKDSAALLTHTAAQIEKNYLDQRTYARCDAGKTGDDCTCNVQPAADRDFSVACAISGTGYLLTASNRDGVGLGAAGDYVFTLNHLGARETVKFAGMTQQNKTCWLLGEDAQC